MFRGGGEGIGIPEAPLFKISDSFIDQDEWENALMCDGGPGSIAYQSSARVLLW